MKEEKKIYDSSMRIYKPWANIYKKTASDGDVYIDGLYYCVHGAVECTSETKRPLSDFRFVYQGKLHMRTIKKSYSQRGLAIMAGKFVKDVIEQIQKSHE